MNVTDIAFPNLSLYFTNVPKTIYIGSFPIALYGIVIALGMFAGFTLAAYLARRKGVNPDLVWDFSVPCILISVAGARVYYVVTSWEKYRSDPVSIFNLRQGGLAIYGGVIAGLITLIVFTKLKKTDFWKFADFIMPGLLVGQIMGRWGNFFNREAFGGYCDSLFAMRLPIEAVRSSDISSEIAAHIVDGVNYIQVHPTFLYEGMWNFAGLIVLLIIGRKAKFDGQVFLSYFTWYGIGRFCIESIRTDQLFIPGTGIPVSMAVSVVAVLVSETLMVIRYKKIKTAE